MTKSVNVKISHIKVTVKMKSILIWANLVKCKKHQNITAECFGLSKSSKMQKTPKHYSSADIGNLLGTLNGLSLNPESSNNVDFVERS